MTQRSTTTDSLKFASTIVIVNKIHSIPQMWHSKIVHSPKIRWEWLRNEDSKHKSYISKMSHEFGAHLNVPLKWISSVNLLPLFGWASRDKKRVNLIVCTLTLFCKLKLSTRTIFGQIMDSSTIRMCAVSFMLLLNQQLPYQQPHRTKLP